MQDKKENKFSKFLKAIFEKLDKRLEDQAKTKSCCCEDSKCEAKDATSNR